MFRTDELWAILSCHVDFIEKVVGNHKALGRPGRVDGTRELLVHRNYFMVYDVKDERIRIVRVLHGARRWPPKI